MIKTYVLKKGQKPTEEMLQQVAEAAKRPIVFDEDCPELTDDQIAEIKMLMRQQKSRRLKRVVSLRLSNESYEKAKKFGDGYTSVLSKILESALNNPKILEECL